MTSQWRRMVAEMKTLLAEDTEGESADEEEGMEHPRKRQRTSSSKRGGNSKSTRNPWATFMKMTGFVLPVEIREQLQEHGDEITPLIDDSFILPKLMGDYASDPGQVGDAFMACYTYARGVKTRLVLDSIRWCFVMLMAYDLVKAICYERTGRRLGKKMERAIREAVEPALQNTPVTVDQVCAELERVEHSRLETEFHLRQAWR